MNALTIIFTIVQLLACVFLIAVVLLQSGKSKSLDATLARMTKWVGIVFVVLTLALSLIK